MYPRLLPALLILALVLSACGGQAPVPTVPPTWTSSANSSAATSTPAVAPPTETAALPATPSPVSATATPQELSWEQLVDQLRPSTVMIRADFPATAIHDEGSGSGTGIVYSSDGYIVTNAHVVEGASAITVAPSGSNKQRSAKFVGVSTCDDLAVIKVDNTDGLKPATFGTTADLKVGQDVAALGYPLGDSIGTDVSVTRGIVSKLDVTLAPYESLVQTDAAINPGNSGGPLVTRAGKVIGINTLKVTAASATNINFAISADQAKTVVEDLKKGRNRLWLGMNLTSNDYEKYFGTKAGVVVEATDAGSPASRSGVKPAFLLTQLAGSTVNSKADVCKILRSHSDGDVLETQFLNVTDTDREIWAGEVVIGDTTKSTPLKMVKQESTSPPTPTAAAVAAAVTPTTAPASPGTVNYDFASDNGDWYTGSTADLTATISGGAYVVALKAPNRWQVLQPGSITTGKNQAIAASVLLKAGFVGVVTRFGKDSKGVYSFYLFYLNAKGSWGCDVNSGGNYVNLVLPTASTLVKPGEVNRLELDDVGTTLTFWINGTKVGTIDDAKVAAGSPGLYVAGDKTTPGSAAFATVAVQVAQ